MSRRETTTTNANANTNTNVTVTAQQQAQAQQQDAQAIEVVEAENIETEENNTISATITKLCYRKAQMSVSHLC